MPPAFFYYWEFQTISGHTLITYFSGGLFLLPQELWLMDFITPSLRDGHWLLGRFVYYSTLFFLFTLINLVGLELILLQQFYFSWLPIRLKKLKYGKYFNFYNNLRHLNYYLANIRNPIVCTIFCN